MQRLLIVGPAGSGKTALAQEIERRKGLGRTELDIVRFDGQWRPLSETDFRVKVAEMSNAERWIIEGNYASVRDLLWRRADTVVWLDYGLPLVLWRLM